MKALEFKSKVRNNSIAIPKGLRRQFKSKKTGDVRVIVLFEEQNSEKEEFKELAKDQFLKGYAESDSVYDQY